MQVQPDERDRLAPSRRPHRRVLEPARVHDGDGPAADDLEHAVGTDERGRVLVEPDARHERVVGERGEEAAEPVALPEVLVDDERVREAEAGRERDLVGRRRRTGEAARDHVLGDNRGAGRGARDVDAGGVAAADGLRDGRAAEDRREAELVAAGDEDARRLFDLVEIVLPRSIGALLDPHRDGRARAELARRGRRRRGPVSSSSDAVGSTTIRASSPPARWTKRSRMAGLRRFFSAPPMGMTYPRRASSGPCAGIGV